MTGVDSISHNEVPRGLEDSLSRAQPKKLAHDYLHRASGHGHAEVPDPAPDNAQGHVDTVPRKEPRLPNTMASIEASQQQAAERWKEKQRLRQLGTAHRLELEGRTLTPDIEHSATASQQKRLDRSYDGPEDGLKL